MNLKTYCLIALATVFSQFTNAQEGLPIYSDYLTDTTRLNTKNSDLTLSLSFSL